MDLTADVTTLSLRQALNLANKLIRHKKISEAESAYKKFLQVFQKI